MPLAYSLPKEIKCILTVITPNPSQQPWLIDFYHSEIQQKLKHIVEDQVFAATHRQASALASVLLLKKYFTESVQYSKATAQDLKPLIKWMKDVDTLARALQDALTQAWARGEEGVFTQTKLQGNLQETIKKLMKAELLLIMRDYAALVDSQATIHRWIHKELNQFGAIAHEGKSDVRRFVPPVPTTKIHRFFEMLTWDRIKYFFMGAPRLPLYLLFQDKALTLKNIQMTLRLLFLHEYALVEEIQNTYWRWVQALTHHRYPYRKAIIMLPISGLAFCLGVISMSLLPYRVARSLVNEVYFMFTRAINWIGEAMWPYSERDPFFHKILKTIAFVIKIASYVALLLAVGLPILPNPFAWLPSFLPVFIPFVALGYTLAVLLGTALEVWRSSRVEEKTEDLSSVTVYDAAHQAIPEAVLSNSKTCLYSAVSVFSSGRGLQSETQDSEKLKTNNGSEISRFSL